MFAKELILKISNLYGFVDDFEVLHRVERGSLSENYILKNGGERYFLKKYRDFGIERLRRVHAVKKFFSERQVSVIMPIQTKSGESFFEYNGRLYSLFPYVEGKQFEHGTLNSVAVRNCGQLLAQIHLQSKGGAPDIVQARLFHWNKDTFHSQIRLIQEVLAKKESKTDLDERVEQFILKKISLAEENMTVYEDFGLMNDHVIHGDFHEENMFFDVHDAVKYLFDWEKANMSPRVMEVVRAMEFICFYGSYEDKNFKKAEVFLKVYSELYPLGRDELAKGLTVGYIHQIHNLWALDEYYLKNNKRVEDFFENHISFLEHYSKNLSSHIHQVSSFLESE